jgi:NADH-quinone oxidoreductase subunit L
MIGALGTAFYMWRLYFLVFGGEERSMEARKAHESPANMTGPLVILALLASLAGAIGLPHLKWVPSWGHALDTWLSRSVVRNFNDPTTGNHEIMGHLSEGTTLALMGVALAIGLSGIGLAYMFYGRGPSPSLDKLVDGPLQQAYQASKAKLWFDEIYDATIVRPFRMVARGLFEIVDRFIIDTVAVTGVAFVVGMGSRISRWFQNGQVQRYLAGLVVGAAAVFLVTDCKTKQSFHFERKGELLELHANTGAGVVGKNSRMTWDITGDGVADKHPETGKILEGPSVTVKAADVTSASVTLIIEDAMSRKTHKVTREITSHHPVQPHGEGEGK